MHYMYFACVLINFVCVCHASLIVSMSLLGSNKRIDLTSLKAKYNGNGLIIANYARRRDLNNEDRDRDRARTRARDRDRDREKQTGTGTERQRLFQLHVKDKTK